MRKISKIKRIFAGLLALLLTVALLPAQTARIAKADPSIPETTTSTIDTSKTGSLTIHKYEYNGTGGTATGEIDDSLPGSGADVPVPLEDVQFKITYAYELDDYYTTAGTLPQITDQSPLTLSPSITVDPTETMGNIASIGNWKIITTASDGVASITGLPLGIYLVEEISAPSQITGKADAFLVSIPMTRQGTLNPGEEWLYDVHVFPKNSSNYGTVYLKKQGQNGSVLVDKLPGAKFELYVRGGSGPGYIWTKVTTNNKGITIGTDTDDNGTIDEVGIFTTDVNGMITIADLAPGHYKFVETDVPADSGYILDTVTVYEFSIEYNDVTSTITTKYTPAGGSEQSVDADHPILVTNYKPNIDKQVKVENTTDTWVGDKPTNNDMGVTDYSKDDTVPFRIVVDIPSNIDQLETFEIKDTLSKGFTLVDAFGISNLTITGHAVADTTLTSGTPITPNASTTFTKNTEADGRQYWQLVFGDDDKNAIKAAAYAKIVISFQATLNSNYVVTAGNGNPNDVKLTYSDQILASGTPTTSDIEDRVVVYTFGIDLTKTFNGNPGGKKATFNLYRALKGGESGDANITVNGTSTSVKTVYTNVEFTEGTPRTFEGLENGTYYLVETKTESGYNLLKEPVTIVVNVGYSVTTSITDPSYSTVYSNNASNPSTITFSDGKYSLTINNSKGFTLPTTGGIGSAIFVFVGVSMMVAAVILFFTSRKKENDKTKP